MRASIDTNVLIHLYSANQEKLLFDFFEDGVYIYEQIRRVELENHGKAVVDRIDMDIRCGRIQLYTDAMLREQGVYRIFMGHVEETKILYAPGDMGEVYAISLAKTIGAYSLVTDDIKQGGPYMSLLHFDDDVKPFNFADVVILCYLSGKLTELEAVKVFDDINEASNLQWSFESQLKRFLRRFWSEPYQEQEKQWIQDYCKAHNTKFSERMKALAKVL